MRKAAFHNLGCKVNAYETEAMQQMLSGAGYEIVPFTEKADVYIINTCSVTNMADRKSRQMLHRAKKQNPDAAVVAAGCYTQAAGEELLKDQAVDILVGNNKKIDLVKILEEYFGDTQKAEEHIPAAYLTDIGQTKEYENLHIDTVSDHTRAFMKIQDGCNQFCTYCIIPYTRGRIRSRRPEEVFKEARKLVEAGYKEIVLTGIHLSSYGKDLEEGEGLLLRLMKELDAIPGLVRMRLGSLEPRIITEEFVGALSKLRTICPHFHLSLQSGSDSVLRRMNRHYTTEEYAAGCELLRAYFDRPAITTDVITGFPQETEEEFQETVEFIKRIGFYELHVFPYSRRAGTRAAAMEGQLSEQEKKRRSDVLLRLDEELSWQYRKSFCGEKKEVLMEEKIILDGQEYLVGHTREYVKAVIPWQEKQQGQMVSGTLKTLKNREIFELE